MINSVRCLLCCLIERGPSDRVVAMMCYAVVIVPEIVDQLLLEKNEHYEPIRSVMSVHLASGEEMFTTFNKVIMSRLLNKTAYSTTCLQKINSESFINCFHQAVSIATEDISVLNVESFQLNSKFSSAVVTCYALLNSAASRLVSNKESLVLPKLEECIQLISRYFESDEKARFYVKFLGF
ncbi:unnamed protein product [Thelazia callipaeda]|uniref:Ras-GAP domain-containing protein n=1 Tax=Thelazia callipaeda TaxID=103827 RepID=A0A0N5CS62_THECL|nr:unnamed protein product [Thelazia callipaeda]